MKAEKKRVMLITNTPTPYRIPLFNEINRLLLETGHSLLVTFAALEEGVRRWNVDLNACCFDYKFLSSASIGSSGGESAVFIYPGLLRLLSNVRPVAVVTNGFSFATTKLCIRNMIKSTPYIIWSGAIENPHCQVSGLKHLQRKFLVRGASGFIAYGKMAKDYLVKLGAQETKVHISINTVDTDFYAREAEHVRRASTENRDTKRLLYLGYLTSRKRVDLLLDVVEQLARRTQNFELLIIGDGPEKEALFDKVRAMGIARFVRFEGHKEKHEIPAYLAQADCLLFPTHFDIWGLVLVEAMAAGVPCVSSIYAGATHDLIQDGVNGFAVDFSDTEAVIERLEWLFGNSTRALDMGAKARSFIAEHASIGKSAGEFVHAVRDVLA
jgi:glycosyltransferase involved in cell wall biosynthesis